MLKSFIPVEKLTHENWLSGEVEETMSEAADAALAEAFAILHRVPVALAYPREAQKVRKSHRRQTQAARPDREDM